MAAAIRPLLPADVDAVAEADFAAVQDAALRHGRRSPVEAVRESRAAVRRLLDGDAVGGVVAELDGRVVGHAWLHPRGPIATFGPLAVEPGAQRRGVGRALLRHCIEAAGSRVTQVRLVHEASDTGALGLFLSEGFRIVAPVLELERAAGAAGSDAASAARTTIRPAEPGDQQRIVARDARAFGAARSHDVERRLRDGRAVVAERDRGLVGYALAGAGRLGSAAAEDPAVVVAMLATLAGALRGARLRAMVLGTDRVLIDGLLGLGFALFGAGHYMIRGGGTAPPSGYVLMGADYL